TALKERHSPPPPLPWQPQKMLWQPKKRLGQPKKKMLWQPKKMLWQPKKRTLQNNRPPTICHKPDDDKARQMGSCAGTPERRPMDLGMLHLRDRWTELTSTAGSGWEFGRF